MNKKILVVDDEKGFTAMLKLNLESTGEYDVRVENDANKALNAALEYQPNLILLDVVMPHKEGPDIAYQLRNEDYLSNVPIIFLTATITKEEAEAQNGRIGGHPFVAKPSNLSVLLESIERNISWI